MQIRVRSEVPKAINRLRAFQREIIELGVDSLAKELAKALSDEIVKGAAPWPGAHERVLRLGVPLSENLPNAWRYIQGLRSATGQPLSGGRSTAYYVVGNWLLLGTGQVGSRARPPQHPIRRFLRWLKKAHPDQAKAEIIWYFKRTRGKAGVRGEFVRLIRGEKVVRTASLARRIRKGGFTPQLAYHFLLARTRDLYARWREEHLDQTTARWWWLFQTGKPTTGFPGSAYLSLALTRYRSRRAEIITSFARRTAGRKLGDRTVEISLAEAVRILRRQAKLPLEVDPLKRYGL